MLFKALLMLVKDFLSFFILIFMNFGLKFEPNNFFVNLSVFFVPINNIAYGNLKQP